MVILETLLIGFFVVLSFSVVVDKITDVFSRLKRGKSNKEVGGGNNNTWLPIDAYVYGHHYLEKGLNDSDVQIFRKIMNSTIESSITLKKELDSSESLKSLFDEEVAILEDYIFLILDSPERLNEAHLLNYKHLPSLLKVVELHKEIECSKVPSDRTLDVLNDSKKSIKVTLDKIADNYNLFMEKKIEMLKEEINYSRSEDNSYEMFEEMEDD